MEKPIQIEYMPMCLEPTSCTIVFCDEEVGEMVYKIELNVDFPQSMGGALSPIKATLGDNDMERV